MRPLYLNDTHPGLAASPRCLKRRGLTLVEITVTLAILAMVMLAFSQALLGSMVATRTSRETAVATEAARQMIGILQASDFDTLFAANNSVEGDDPAGLPTRLAAFDVPGLNLRIGDLDGLCGQILLPESVAGGASELREDIQDLALDMPRDLNGDGLIDAQDHAEDYAILPVVVRVDWRSASGPARVQFKTILSSF